MTGEEGSYEVYYYRMENLLSELTRLMDNVENNMNTNNPNGNNLSRSNVSGSQVRRSTGANTNKIYLKKNEIIEEEEKKRRIYKY